MCSEPLILGFDTSAAHCAAALLCGNRVIAAMAEDMTRGQAERLMPMLEEVLDQGGAAWADLTRIAVGTGPGNFTGIRLAVSAARGLSLSLGVPAIGVSGFEAICAHGTRACVPAVPAPREHVYVRPDGQTAALMTRAEAEATFADRLAYPPDSTVTGDCNRPDRRGRSDRGRAFATGTPVYPGRRCRPRPRSGPEDSGC